MAKVFTITEGLANMGALKTGGQGSVYKGKRVGEIITAVKLLPTPIHTESADDKNFRDFQNEVEKLKKVNEVPNPHVAKILNSGITDSGAFPFIEMEFIEGPDLEELLKPPHHPVFTIKETLKVAEGLSNALAHCHKVNVKHGDIKSNNVKFNIHTGNYVLLDFGLAVMSDEQRRTSLRHAGAIEFMAPEQNEGRMLFQTDIYSFGVIIYELLGGQVPFPLTDNGETNRNAVMVAHMETPPPDVMALRSQHLPQSWDRETREREMGVPAWLLETIYTCLQKNPENRFRDGVALHQHIITQSIQAVKAGGTADELAVLQEENSRLRKLVYGYQETAAHHDGNVQQLKAALAGRDAEVATLRNKLAVSNTPPAVPRKGVSRGAFFALLLLTAIFGSIATYALLNKKRTNRSEPTTGRTAPVNSNTDKAIIVDTAGTDARKRAVTKENKKTLVQKEPSSSLPAQRDEKPAAQNEPDRRKSLGRYTVIDKAYFHNEPDESTRRNAFIVHWNKATLDALEEKGDFIYYVVFTNHLGQTSKGWLRKSDLKRAP